jgi:hypothetical protein
MTRRYFRHRLAEGQAPHRALSSLAGATGLIVRVDRRPDRTDVIVATEDETYQDVAAKSELGEGEPVTEADVTVFGQ